MKEMIMKNLQNNPFYKTSDKDLLKKIHITAHLKSETPYIPIDKMIIKDTN